MECCSNDSRSQYLPFFVAAAAAAASNKQGNVQLTRKVARWLCAADTTAYTRICFSFFTRFCVYVCVLCALVTYCIACSTSVVLSTWINFVRNFYQRDSSNKSEIVCSSRSGNWKVRQAKKSNRYVCRQIRCTNAVAFIFIYFLSVVCVCMCACVLYSRNAIAINKPKFRRRQGARKAGAFTYWK